MIFTFWEGKMPAYIELCLKTWKHDYVMLNYNNLNQYTDLPIEKLKRFTLPQIADIVRVHVLRDNGGYWLDTDTIMITDELPKETIMGNASTRMNTIGYLHTKPYSHMFRLWAQYQDYIIDSADLDITPLSWDIVGNKFTDSYLQDYKDISIGDVTNRWAETYMIKTRQSRYDKYRRFYFGTNYHLSDLEPTNMLMLHNSWTPQYYKEASEQGVLNDICTMSNILREVLQ